ncbi:hypothetical protein HU200_015400 [Digitaria exilis]|uniref:Reverse transcriptase domain-containing protein n=1 Tax=Digitaria exilis TaxID=1010633 RepID=A0A835FAB8_9POAL|nr:hypothetical protein HU200_015400 [Digitaria exilis]
MVSLRGHSIGLQRTGVCLLPSSRGIILCRSWCFTAVYGPQPDEDKVEFLDELRSIRQNVAGPWLIAGDFNLLLEATDKNNRNINRRNMGRFRQFVNDMELKDLPLHGRRYTWSNEQNHPTLERLDRVLVTADWDAMFPFSFMQALSSDMSDHAPLHLATNALPQPKRRFHFENWWLRVPGHMEAIEHAWCCPAEITNPYSRLDHMLRKTVRALQSWSHKQVGQVKEQLLLARELVRRFDRAMERRGLSADEVAFRRDLKLKLLALASLERTIARLRSRLVFLKDGDANTRLFHLQSSHRVRKKHIPLLEWNGTVALSQEDKAAILFDYFSAAIGSVADCPIHMDLAAVGIEQLDLTHLELPFTEEEVWSTIKSMPREKSPGPDGFTVEFYGAAWRIIKHDIMRAFEFFYATNRGQLHRLNGAFVTLLPKKPDARTPSDYRPISLIHSFAKLVAKVLANSLAPSLHTLVSINQSAFIKARSIHENFKLVELSAKALHRARKPSLLLKLDISKAFDTVDWVFLLQVLMAMGFGSRWRDWISALVSTASTSILLNGEPGGSIKNKRGLRQGDPLSPMLFILVMEVLHRLFTAAKNSNVLAPPPIRNVHHQCSIYADDVMLFVSPTRQDLITTREVLEFFGKASGLRTNLAKCQAVRIACQPDEIELIGRILPVPIKAFPITYLGLPLSATRLRKADLQPMIDKVAAAVPTWKAALMNKAGRLTTIKSVMCAKNVHVMISLKIPDWVMHEIDKYNRGFLWSGKARANGGQCLFGGLGIPDLRVAALALRLRWLWLKRTDANRPWRNLDLAFGEDPVVAAMFMASVDIQLGDGSLALFWAERWMDLCKLIRSSTTKQRTVAQALANKTWISDIKGRLTVALDAIRIILCAIGLQALLRGVCKVCSIPASLEGLGACMIAFGQPIVAIGTAYRTPRLVPSVTRSERPIWSAISVLLQLPDLVNQSTSLTDWWLQIRRRHTKLSRRGIDTTVLLAVHLIMQEANLWAQAGASHLGSLGWPLSIVVVGTTPAM